MDDQAKKKMANEFEKMQSNIPVASTNFENQGRSTIKKNMANIFSALPPPPPPPAQAKPQ